jgi:hypothetical protein
MEDLPSLLSRSGAGKANARPSDVFSHHAHRITGRAGRLTSGPLARLLETSWVRGLDRFDGKTEVARFQMPSEPRCAACLVAVSQHSIALIQTALGRPQETAQKLCYTPPGTRQRGAVGAG